MSGKSALKNKSALLAGRRHALPGQGPDHEAGLRAELTEYFVPEGPVESMWVADIAYCMTEIEVIRAQIAGFRMLCVRKVHQAELGAVPFPVLHEDEMADKRSRAGKMERFLWELFEGQCQSKCTC